MNRKALLAFCALSLALACKRDEPRILRTPPQAESAQQLNPELPPGHPPIPADPQAGNMPSMPPPSMPAGADSLAWDLPKGWTEARAGGMRLATLKPPVTGKIDVSVIVLPGTAGGELANVNRWRGQIGLQPVDEAGRAQGYRGVARDATERRRLEEELRSLTRAVDQSPASVVITDTRAKVEYVNARFCEVSGYAPQELLGRNPNILKSGKTPLETYQQMWKAIAAGKEWRGEFCNRKKNGELFWESLIISALKNDEGSITHYLAVKEDITERKRMEKEREILEIQLRQAQKLESVGQLAAGMTTIGFIGSEFEIADDEVDHIAFQ